MSEEIIITNNCIRVIDGDVSAHFDFFCEIDESKKNQYIEELRQEIAEKKKYVTVPAPEITDYKLLRRINYPDIGDQLDALWKGGDAAAEMLAKIQAVKNKYPKSE